MRSISFGADSIISCTGEVHRNACVVCDESGKILEIVSQKEVTDYQYFKGLIVPGFVNAHCHLELSHMKGLIPTGSGLIDFIAAVVTQRDFAQELIEEAIIRADREMYENGIVAVGDICNKVDTALTKANSRMKYCSFVELFDFLQDGQASNTLEIHKSVYSAMPATEGHKKFMVPHASYSVSPSLFKLINHFNEQAIISIHNQELQAENDLFLSKSGGFISFYQQLGIELSQFRPNGKTAIHYVLEHLRPEDNILFVHNTQTTRQEIQLANQRFPKSFWVSCPNANLYIENKLPDFRNFTSTNAKVCIGTDSLSSNWQLSILEELKTIKRYQSYLEDELLLIWACRNGAEALGFADKLGTIEAGKTPGLVHIELEVDESGKFRLDQARRVSRII